MEKRATFSLMTVGLLFALPMILLIFVFFYWPASQAVFWAFTLEKPWGGGNAWVGLQNFQALLNDPLYWASIGRSMVFALTATVIGMFLGLMLALLIDRQLPGHKLYRSVLIWPYAIAPPALGLAFRFILAPKAGLLASLNHIWPNFWDPTIYGNQAMISIIIAYTWGFIGYNVIFFVAALQAIPRSLIEAAAMDGAGPWRRMRDLQIPLLTPTLFFLLVINITDSFQYSFGIVDIMTEGGPARATELMVYKIYFDGFKGLDYSGAAAQSVILMLLVIALTVVQFRFIERRVHYK